MTASTIQSRLSATDLTLKPGSSIATVDVDVVNSSDRHASFHIVLSATGAEGQPPRRWYQLTPMTSTKVPPGTRSTYTVKITDTPFGNFVGLANVTVRIISPELQSEERHVLRLQVEPGLGVVTFKAELPIQTFQDYPGQRVEIPARVYNGNRHPLTVDLACPGLDSWLVDNPSTLQLLPNRWRDVVLTCEIPEDLSLSQSQDYPFQVLIVDAEGESATASGVLEVLPLGYCQMVATETVLELPAQRHWFPNRRANTTQTQLQLENHSNLVNQIQVAAVPPPPVQGEEPCPEDADYRVELAPEAIALNPGEVGTVDVTIQADRPWWGWARNRWINLQAQLQDARLDLRNDSETLQVNVAPIIPGWLQLLALLLCSGAIASLWLLHAYRQHHHQLVSTVEFNGTGTHVVSGSSDQTIRQWQVRRWGLRPAGDRLRFDKAVRVLQVRPVDNNQLMVGLENGEAQIWDLLAPGDRPQQTLVHPTDTDSDLDDRVMALAATADSRYLFTGHGSGQINQWYVGPDQARSQAADPAFLEDISEPLVQDITVPEMAIYDLALVGPQETRLAIAGRYNKVLLWPWTEPEGDLVAIAYPLGGQDDYVTAIATVEQNSSRLATADNQGRIMVWDLADCLDQPETCAVLDQWQVAPDTAVRDIAFSADGCFLASASDDGRVMLWPLTQQGRRLTRHLQGQTVFEANTRFNSVDIKVVHSRILIASGADDHRVRLHRLKASSQSCQ